MQRLINEGSTIPKNGRYAQGQSQMRGYVETPESIVDLMVSKLFRDSPPSKQNAIVDAGAGKGAFIDGIIRWCKENSTEVPHIVGVEINHKHALRMKEKYENVPQVSINETDFLMSYEGHHSHAIANPPFVPITALGKEEKQTFRANYKTAIGRFDLYLLFFEKALDILEPGGKLVFITPEKFLYVETASALRKILSAKRVEEIQMIDESTFGDLITYPTITVVSNKPGPCETSIVHRDGRTTKTTLPTDGSSWWPRFTGGSVSVGSHLLEDICERISPGVATGADSVFVLEPRKVGAELRPFAYPTIAGRELGLDRGGLKPSRLMLIPYDRKGKLIDPNGLGALMSYLSEKQIREKLMKRTCVERKPWYAFHETPPLPEILRPKILCKDITKEPHFWIDNEGRIVPRHTVYYLVPRDPRRIRKLMRYLNSDQAKKWLVGHCQRAANGFLRTQSHVLKQLPIPEELWAKATF